MLLLKLLLVPSFLVLVTLIGKRWGPGVAGCLSGFPFSAGPILFIVALEQGPVFAASAATASLAAVCSTIVFCAAYAHASLWFGWVHSLLIAFGAWGSAAFLLTFIPIDLFWVSLPVALLSLLIAPTIFPRRKTDFATRPFSLVELAVRAGAGATLTLIVSFSAEAIGTSWSGLLTTYPVIGTVMATFSHHKYGPEFVTVLLRAMATGLYSLGAFFLVLALSLAHWGTALGFIAATVFALLVQFAMLKLRSFAVTPKKGG